MPPNFYCHELALASCFESYGALKIAFRASSLEEKMDVFVLFSARFALSL